MDSVIQLNPYIFNEHKHLYDTEVRLRDYGSEMVEVLDNGSGVEPANFQALSKHLSFAMAYGTDRW